MNYTTVTEALNIFSGLSSVPKHILDNAVERGTYVDIECKLIMSDMESPIVDQHIGYIDGFKKWAKDKVFITPSRFYCDDLMLTGECDGLYKLNETEWCLFDIKTPLKESLTWQLQLSAYAYLARKAGYNVTRLEVVQLFKDGRDANIFTYCDDFSRYLYCLFSYQHFFKNKKQEEYLSCL